mmetsp:Transcript_7975/g.15024  ORF Transcript_7975/g.15024 Transcript_7975/m.15024 type:complete len:527 (+) Transcript_7975:165-1745(+)
MRMSVLGIRRYVTFINTVTIVMVIASSRGHLCPIHAKMFSGSRGLNVWSNKHSVRGRENLMKRVLSNGRHFCTHNRGFRFFDADATRPRNGIKHHNGDILDTLQAMERSDCFEDDEMSNDLPCRDDDDESFLMYARLDSIKSHDDSVHCNFMPPMKKNLQNLIRGCYFACPGEAYYQPKRRLSTHDWGEETLITSLRTLKEKVIDVIPPTIRRKRSSGPAIPSLPDELDETLEEEPSPAILSGIIQQIVPSNIWNALTGREFFFPSVLSGLVRTGIQTALLESEECIEWNPADTKTRKLLEMSDKNAIRKALDEDDVLVWIGKFKVEGHGSHLPIVRTASVLPMSPKDMASLLMDSSKVQTYNKMSLGRSDEIILQEGIDTEAKAGSMAIGGEAKIVRNLTKPPLSKKLMEFVTVMYARRLESDDNVGVGIMGGNHQDGYIVVSRAVSGGQWGRLNLEDAESERARSEILLGVNLIRSIPGDTKRCEVIAVTHCNSPFVPKMLAGSVGVKGAVDFVRDVRALFGNA